MYLKSGVGVILECLTNNKNRTTAYIREVIKKYNIVMSSHESVTHTFDQVGRIYMSGKYTTDELFEFVLGYEYDVKDIYIESSTPCIIV